MGSERLFTADDGHPVGAQSQPRISAGQAVFSTRECNADASHCVFRHVACCDASGSVLVFSADGGSEAAESSGWPPFRTRDVDPTQSRWTFEAGKQQVTERKLNFALRQGAFDETACTTHLRSPILIWGLPQDWNFGHLLMV
jgi:hypothetical protein